MSIIDILKKEGESKGLCVDWQNKLKDGISIKRLCQLYIRGIDFCISEDYPTLEMLQDDFKGKCEAFGIYVDESVSYAENVPDIVLNGTSKANLFYNSYSVSRLYIRHQSKANITISGKSMLTIDAFDDSVMNINTLVDDCNVFVNLYGNARVNALGSGIKIRETHKITY